MRISKWLYSAMMCLAFCITGLVFTNPYHHLYYSYVGFDQSLMYSPLVLKHGPLYIINLATLVIYNGGTAVVIFKGYKKSSSHLKRRLSVYSLLMMVSSVTGFALYFLDVANGYDTTMFGLTASAIFLTILFFRCRIFDVVDMAKDYALDNSSEGLLIYDESGGLVYENPSAAKIVGNIIPTDYLQEVREGNLIYKKDDLVYSVTANPLMHNTDYLGKSVEVHDITRSYNHRERLAAAVADTTEKLEGVQRKILGAFASLVEARSLETGDHIKRVSRYTEMIARSLKESGEYTDILTEKYINILVSTAPLHDVGKISISDVILLKPGRLTSEEFEEMKKHSMLGAQVVHATLEGLESEDYVKMASDVALYHHEWWNGSGYPVKLSGEQIPLAARIVAVADCYDAMTSKRCYKDAFPDERALNIIQEESGTHFDPKVVTAFINSKYSMEH